MDTDEGITGATRIADGEAVASLTRRRLKTFIGDDVLLTERLWTKMWEIDRIEETNMAHFGLIDLLAWDLKSKKANLPAYKLMGGNDPKIPAYASTVTWDEMGEYERHIKECVDEGFVAFKLHAWGDWKEDAKLCRNLRKWTGDDATLMFDGSAGWDLTTSLKFGRVLEECGFYWYEEPMREFDLTSYRKLADSLDIPVLAAETSDGVALECRDLDRYGGARHDPHVELLQRRSHRRAEDRSPRRGAWDEGRGARHGRRQRASRRRDPQQRLLRATGVFDRAHQGAQKTERAADH